MTPLPALALWALATMALAPLPIRYQIVPGLLSLLVFPVLLIWAGIVYGVWIVIAGVLAAVSLFRKPLAALGRHLKQRVMRSR